MQLKGKTQMGKVLKFIEKQELVSKLAEQNIEYLKMLQEMSQPIENNYPDYISDQQPSQ